MPAVRYFLFIVCISSFLSTFSQSVLPEPGKLTQEEIQLKDCPFDAEANAVIIFDDAFTDYKDEGGMVTKRRIRIKILNEKGIESGNIVIPFYSADNYEFIQKVSGATMNIDASGVITYADLDKKTVFVKKIDNYFSEVRFAMPAVRAGSIIEYSYESEKKNFNPRSWEFQSELPVMKSCYLLQIPPTAEFTYSIQKKKNYRVDIKPIPDLGRVYFEMRNVPALRREPFMDAAGDFIQRVIFQFSGYTSRSGYKNEVNTTWRELAYTLMTDKEFGSQLDKDNKPAELQPLVNAETSASGKLRAIYKYVRENIEWDGYNGKYLDQGIKKTLEKKRADAGDINLLLINLLKSHGIETYPLLVAERHFGKVDTTFPFIDRFNKVVALALADGQQFILDATRKFNPADLTPSALLNTTGFVVDKKGYQFLHIESGELSSKDRISINASLENNGTLKGEVTIRSYDYSRTNRAEDIKDNRKKFINDNFIEPYDNMAVDSFMFVNLDKDSEPLEQVVQFNQKLNENGGFVLLNYNLFTGLEKNPFISSLRFSDINFGHGFDIALEAHIKLPQNSKAEELPKDRVFESGPLGIRVSRELKIENGELRAVLKFSQSSTLIHVDSYNVVKDFYKQMIEFLNEPVVLKLTN